MAATTRALTPTATTPYTSSLAVAPDTPTSLSSQSAAIKSLAPALTTAASQRTPASPRSQKLTLSPRYSPQPLTGAAALEDQHQLRQERARQAARQTSPNPAAAALRELLGQGQSGAIEATTRLSEPVAQMAQKISIPEVASSDNVQTSPVSMSSVGSIGNTTVPATSASIMAPVMPPHADDGYSEGNIHTSRAAVDAGVDGGPDSRAFTFPPPPAEDPRIVYRNMSLPNTGYGNNSPKTQGAKRHKCPYCSTVFTRHHNLKSHLLTHSQEKPYECQQCQSRFRRLHDLKRHTKLHTGERPHECPKCGRKFARGDALARHNKGQGGCAGRRSDYGLDDDGDGRIDESMDGVEYTQEPELMDDEGRNDSRRGSEVSHRQEAEPYRAGPSSYPPLGGRLTGGDNVAHMYPPPPTQHSSPQPRPSSIPHFAGAQQPVFGQSGVTESPKPLSPGHPDSRGGAPGHSRPSYPQHYVPSAGHGPSHQLPPLPSSYRMPPPGASPLPGSLSSHSGSGASGRELFGNHDAEMWNRLQDMEARLANHDKAHVALVARLQATQADNSRLESLENDYRSRIAQLESNERSLKEELSKYKAKYDQPSTK